MWTKKDTLNMTLAAAATFAVTVAMFLPRIVNATNDKAPAVVLSPVLHVGDCEVTAKVSGNSMTYAGGAKDGQAIPGTVQIAEGALPTFKFVISNPTNAEATVSFTATLASTTFRDMISRRPAMPTQQWTQPYNLTLKPHETREVEVDTKASLASGSNGQLSLQAADLKGSTMNVLTFNVPQINPNAQAKIAPAVQIQTPINTAKPVTFITQQPAPQATIPTEKSPVKVAVDAAVKVALSDSKTKSSQPSFASNMP